MRALYTILFLAFIAGGSWWIVTANPMDGLAPNQDEDKRFLALEARYSPHQIMETHRDELLQHADDEFGNASLKFYPFILMEVRFSLADKRVREGVVLWSQESGEMIVDTDTWESTHGFSHGMLAGADGHDYKIVKALAANDNKMTRDELRRFLRVGADTLDDWTESALSRDLVTQHGNTLKLKQNGINIDVEPQTKIHQWLVTKPYSRAIRAPSRFAADQILETAGAHFGPQLTIKSHKEVYLPVYSISVQDKKGTERTTFWNALNGRRVPTTPSKSL